MVERESRIVARGALQIAQTFSRAEESQQKALLAKKGKSGRGRLRRGVYNFHRQNRGESSGGSKAEGVISSTHAEEGAVAGATHEALMQLMPKALGLNVGAKLVWPGKANI